MEIGWGVVALVNCPGRDELWKDMEPIVGARSNRYGGTDDWVAATSLMTSCTLASFSTFLID